MPDMRGTIATGAAPKDAVCARVRVTAKPLWRLRLASELPRLILLGAAAAGLAACARYAIAPPRPASARGALPVDDNAPARDLAAEGFAQLFARRYLTWDASDPEVHQQGLAAFVGAGMEVDAGLQPPPTGEEQVLWTAIVQERIAAPDERIYTVAAQTDTAGLAYLAVGVARAPGGALELAGYPAFVGAPASAPSIAPPLGPEATDPALRTVVERALRNYLADAPGELAADLTSAARVSAPVRPLDLEALQRLDWAPAGAPAPGLPGAAGSPAAGVGVVEALVQAQDSQGARYTLAYELDVARVAGRWEVAAIEMNPDT